MKQSNLNTDRGEMTVPLLRKTQVMVSFGEVQSRNENGYIIQCTMLRSCLALSKTLKRVDIKGLLWLKLIECILHRHLLCDTLNFESKNPLCSETIQDTSFTYLLTFSMCKKRMEGSFYIVVRSHKKQII